MATDDKNGDKNKNPQDHDRRRMWEDLLFGTIDRIAATPGKLKDPKESITSAFDWVKGIREEVGDRVKEEVSSRIGKLDFNQIASKVADHLAKNYEVKVDARVRWVKKEQAFSSQVSQKVSDSEPVDVEVQDMEENEGRQKI